MVFARGDSGFGVMAFRFGARVAQAILDNQDISEKKITFATTVLN